MHPIKLLRKNLNIFSFEAQGLPLEATQEMLTLGLCNVVGSFFQSMPVTGSFSRSAVNNASGVRTPLGGVYTGEFHWLIKRHLHIFVLQQLNVYDKLRVIIIGRYNAQISSKKKKKILMTTNNFRYSSYTCAKFVDSVLLLHPEGDTERCYN